MAGHLIWVDPDGEPILESETLAEGVVVVRLIGEDGNVFNIIGQVLGALREAGQDALAEAFRERAFAAGSYDEVLRLVMEIVDVE